MRHVALLSILPFALLFACGARHATPSLSMDFQPGGVPLDVAGPDAEDVPGTREDVLPAEDRLVPPDEGQEAVGDDVPVRTDVPVGDNVPPACEENGIRGAACGLNGAGLKPQSCIGGQWVDGGPCQDPDACTDSDILAQPCGLNARGQKKDACANGQWVPGACVDPDVCKDGDATVAGCGKGNTGTQAQRCKNGKWVPEGACAQPGRWSCQNNACSPIYGDPACGDGACDPRGGESPTSCPADCDFGDTEGQGQPCNDAIDCAFFAWHAQGPGYWECAGFLRRTCNAVATTQYCGTPGYDYCYLDASAIETTQSCPQDCTPQYLNCGSDLECTYLDWPAP